MKYKNYYEILGVDRKTSKENIKIKYRKLAKKHHPDSNNGTLNDDFFKDINEAYDTLINDDKKRKYDKQIAKYGYGYTENTAPLTNIRYEIKSGTNVLNDIFSNILGFKNSDTTTEPKQKPIRGKDILSSINISLDEGLVGTEKKIAINGYRGGIKTFSVNVPIGIKNNDKIRLSSLGFPGKYGGKNGDIIISVNLIENKFFKLDGINLVKEINITPARAVLGTNYKVNIFNEVLHIPLPKYLKNNEIITYKGYGYIDEDGNRGDLLLKATIDLPNNITEREENLYKQLYKMENKKI